MRAVVTGGAGFLGSHLTDRLIKEGWPVLVIDNLITGSLDNLAHLLNQPPTPNPQPLEFLMQDVTEYLDVEGPVDFVFHFASPASPVDFLRFPIPVLKAGALGTHKALGLAKAKGAKFMLASTSEVYGDHLVNPQPETYWGNVNPIGPRGVYDEAKRYAEAMTMAYHNFHGLDTRIARFFNTYGPRMRLDDGRVVPNFIAQALRGEPLTVYGDGSHTRCFCYYEDVIEAVWRLANLGPLSRTGEDGDPHFPVNIGSDDERTVLEFAHEVIKAVPHTPTPPHPSHPPISFLDAATDDPKQRRPDLTRAREILAWSPTTPLSEGLAKTVESFKSRFRD